MPISSLIFALILTIAVECPVAYAMGLRKKYQIYIIALVNVITNPALNYLLVLFRIAGLYSFSCLVVMEMAVVFIEWMIIFYAFKEDKKRLFLLSFIMNGVSYAAGVLIQNV